MGLFSWFKKDSEEVWVKIADMRSDSIEGWSDALARSATLRRVLLNNPYAVFKESKLKQSEKGLIVILTAINEVCSQQLQGRSKCKLTISKSTLKFVGVTNEEEFSALMCKYLDKIGQAYKLYNP